MLTKQDIQQIGMLFENHEKVMMIRFEKLLNSHERILVEQLDRRFEKIESRLDKIDVRLDTLEQNLTSFKQDVKKSFEAVVTNLDDRLIDHEYRIKRVEGRLDN
ncbi:hypothetical protein A3H80_04810 [Candidatus Roizmanbacteria bacterium RIFCSPLOWO2_02_FULL_37_19]|uniref:Uncharacterized protein n=1 Tax=Candidatus Roizmanbacteria bacterium RIFCSPHIGHO2_02_FULL_37_24 TaxID=1802037 RepID=A0A1F7GWR0_9BACT|nr:MAG: hypothetical protein A2862_02170 [Candidatus Roizmanbacteria bacterium RIFCSPHIGHO2_01_FULL_38_41]OGK23204.1 MAG: hypothetical protein A3C24_00925 [Candidatus Roizmanbacteria bacterium RIFCSPHIGHO2_02_FULL_37_24]OGK32478.1 MAG: hypothetical protein A3E10_01335 [Candidatus Roizmanbacteria bacterium RIFCSPHIGHO2_12_FULL_37_23]OGK43617.1 MAG: hypothetical protein A2956_04270 [Candidatus Roizmanbacteria bacterium RIFCSPLOWO2_01_FULL_37_57]OGK54801.1 MAG: hypothetical protein A3H80_04810 [Ca